MKARRVKPIKNSSNLIQHWVCCISFVPRPAKCQAEGFPRFLFASVEPSLDFPVWGLTRMRFKSDI